MSLMMSSWCHYDDVIMVSLWWCSLIRVIHTIFVTIMEKKVVVQTTHHSVVIGLLLVILQQLVITMVTAIINMLLWWLLMLGCPFRHWDIASLKSKLKSLGLTHKAVLEIMSKVEGGHYQISCHQLFELTHPVSQWSLSDCLIYSINRITMVT